MLSLQWLLCPFSYPIPLTSCASRSQARYTYFSCAADAFLIVLCPLYHGYHVLHCTYMWRVTCWALSCGWLTGEIERWNLT